MAWDLHPACATVEILDRAAASVKVTPSRRKVAIVGFATNTLHLVPWYDADFEIWSMNQGHLHCARRTDRHFEMHLPESTADIRDPDYLQWLAACPVPVYMTECRDEVPASVRYPIEAAIRFLGGRDYFMSSVAYMVTLAAMEGFEAVHLYGINLAIGDEYFYEKPNAEYLLGFLEGRGVTVYVPGASSLLKQFRRYGYSVDARPAQGLRAYLSGRISMHKQACEKAQAEFHLGLGAMREAEALSQIAEGLDRGADLVMLPPPPAPEA